ncbi:MAG: acylneuraminate cytidylyltransferase family protein [Pseudomonadota bacterium]
MSQSTQDARCAFIFARGGSKGVPHKNIRMLAGKPLIAYSIDVARQSASIERVVVSTDDQEIARVAREHGADVPFIRPSNLAQDNSSELDAWKHAVVSTEQLMGERIETFISLPATSPLRSVEDVERCIAEYDRGIFDIVVTIKEAARSPWFNMLKKIDDDRYGLVNASPENELLVRRQDAPVVYDMTTVAYVAKRDYVMKTDSVLGGCVGAVLIPEHRALDIDTMHDFEVAELMLSRSSNQ